MQDQAFLALPHGDAACGDTLYRPPIQRGTYADDDGLRRRRGQKDCISAAGHLRMGGLLTGPNISPSDIRPHG
jgi:hypothetical protein